MLKEDILKWIATPTGLFVCSSVVTLSSTLAIISLPKVYHSLSVDKAEPMSDDSEADASSDNSGVKTETPDSDTSDTESQVDMSPVRVDAGTQDSDMSDTETQSDMSEDTDEAAVLPTVDIDPSPPVDTLYQAEVKENQEREVEAISNLLAVIPAQGAMQIPGPLSRGSIRSFKRETAQDMLKRCINDALKNIKINLAKQNKPRGRLENTKVEQEKARLEQIVTRAVELSTKKDNILSYQVLRNTLIGMLSVAAVYQLTPGIPPNSLAPAVVNNTGLYASYTRNWAGSPSHMSKASGAMYLPDKTGLLDHMSEKKRDSAPRNSLVDQLIQRNTHGTPMQRQQTGLTIYEQPSINKFEQQPSMRAELTTIFQQPFIKKMGSLFEHVEVVATQLEVVATAWALPEVWHGLKGSQSYKPAGKPLGYFA